MPVTPADFAALMSGGYRGPNSMNSVGRGGTDFSGFPGQAPGPLPGVPMPMGPGLGGPMPGMGRPLAPGGGLGGPASMAGALPPFPPLQPAGPMVGGQQPVMPPGGGMIGRRPY